MVSGDTALRAIFAEVGDEFGYGRVSARYHPFKEFKTTWQMSGNTIAFRVSDYLRPAASEVKRSYARALFARVCNGKRVSYANGMEEWLRSSEFRSRNRPLYLERSRNLALTQRGNVYDLAHLRANLIDLGLIDPGDASYLTWTKGPNRKRVGYCNVLMGVVAVTCALDSPRIPGYVPEYVLYHELLHIDMGADSLSPRHDRLFRRRERMHPRWRDAEDWLRRIASRRE